MDETLQRQSVGEGRGFCRPSDSQRGNGHHQLGQLQRVDNHLRHVDSGAQIAVAQSFLVHEVAERLGVEQRVDGRILEREEVVVAWRGLTLLTPTRGAMKIGTDGKHHWGTGHHGLVEVGRGQSLLHFSTARHHHAIQLQIAHSLRACCLVHQAVQQLVGDFFLTILANCSPCH